MFYDVHTVFGAIPTVTCVCVGCELDFLDTALSEPLIYRVPLLRSCVENAEKIASCSQGPHVKLRGGSGPSCQILALQSARQTTEAPRAPTIPH